MPNQVQYDGAYNLAGQANNMFQSGMKGLTGAIDSYRDRTRKTAINSLLTKPLGEKETADDYSNNMRMSLSNIEGIDPLQALNLADAASRPVFAQEARQVAANQYDDKIMQQDVTNAYKDANLVQNQTDAESLAGYRSDTLSQKTVTHPETGETLGWDEDSSSYKTPIFKGISEAGVPSKYIDTVKRVNVHPVTGAKTTTSYTVDKRKPGYDLNTGLPIPESLEYTQLAQADKDKADSIQSTMSLLANAVGGKFDPGTVGNADRFAAWLDNSLAFDWGEDTEKTIINSGRWNILGGKLVKTMYGGNASDADRTSVFQFVPQSSDNETTYKAKAKEFAKLLTEEHKLFTNRVNRSNPGYMPKIGEVVDAPDGNTYKIIG